MNEKTDFEKSMQAISNKYDTLKLIEQSVCICTQIMFLSLAFMVDLKEKGIIKVVEKDDKKINGHRIS